MDKTHTEKIKQGCGKDLTLSNNAFCGEYNKDKDFSYYCVKCRAQLKEAERHDRIMKKIKEMLVNIKPSNSRGDRVLTISDYYEINKIEQEEDKC